MKSKLFDSPIYKEENTTTFYNSLYLNAARRYRFNNGYGASVIRTQYRDSDGALHYFSRTSNEYEWELAVLKYEKRCALEIVNLKLKIDNSLGDLDYATPITNDVMGFLTTEEVEHILQRIKKL